MFLLIVIVCGRAVNVVLGIFISHNIAGNEFEGNGWNAVCIQSTTGRKFYRTNTKARYTVRLPHSYFSHVAKHLCPHRDASCCLSVQGSRDRQNWDVPLFSARRYRAGRGSCYNHHVCYSCALVSFYHSVTAYLSVFVQVISLGDSRSYYLSTAKNHLGVVVAKSDSGAIMVPVNWQEMRCPITNVKQFRKVAKTTMWYCLCVRLNIFIWMNRIADTGSAICTC